MEAWSETDKDWAEISGETDRDQWRLRERFGVVGVWDEQNREIDEIDRGSECLRDFFSF